MNITNLSEETLTQLVTIALESNPKAVAIVLLEAISEPPKLKQELTVKQKFTPKQVTERAATLHNICSYMRNAERVAAIKLLRIEGGLSLVEAKDAICMAIGEDLFDAKNITSKNKYWYHAIDTYNRTGETIMEI